MTRLWNRRMLINDWVKHFDKIQISICCTSSTTFVKCPYIQITTPYMYERFCSTKTPGSYEYIDIPRLAQKWTTQSFGHAYLHNIWNSAFWENQNCAFWSDLLQSNLTLITTLNVFPRQQPSFRVTTCLKVTRQRLGSYRVQTNDGNQSHTATIIGGGIGASHSRESFDMFPVQHCHWPQV